MASTNYGRHLIPHPDLNTPAGSSLHAEVVAGFSKIGNNLTGRWSGNTASLANGASVSLEHNFGLASTSLRVVIQEGTATLDTAQRDARYTITYTDNNNLSITNITGGAVSNVSFYVFPRRYISIDSLEIAPVNSSITGSNATLGTPTTALTRLVNASLVSITNITAPTRGVFFALFNDTGNNVTIINDAGGTAAARILTGTSANIVLTAGASLLLFYDLTEARWLVVGGAGSGGYSSASVLNLADGGSITTIQSGLNKYRVAGNSAAVTLSTTPFGTTAPLDGTEVVLIGNSNTNTVTITHNDIAKGAVCNGSVTLTKGASVVFIYDAAFDRWVEKSRNIISIA